MVTQIFLNLPVKNLDQSIAFFTALGYTFNPHFTNENATCMIISDTIFVMLLVEPFFKSFTDKEIADTTKTTEVMICLSAISRQQVDEIVDKALKAGGTVPRKPQDHGWMYGWGFTDLDGHIWEYSYMNMEAMPQN